MKKKSTSKKRSRSSTTKPKRRHVMHRVTTHRPNGSLPESRAVAPGDDEVPVGEAMRRAVEALGEIAIDDQLAPQRMRELGECYEEVAREAAAFNRKNEAAKIAKKSLEAAQNVLIEKIRAFTHPAPLPLFDQAQREEDHEDMLEAANEPEAPSDEAAAPA